MSMKFFFVNKHPAGILFCSHD